MIALGEGLAALGVETVGLCPPLINPGPSFEMMTRSDRVSYLPEELLVRQTPGPPS